MCDICISTEKISMSHPNDSLIQCVDALYLHCRYTNWDLITRSGADTTNESCVWFTDKRVILKGYMCRFRDVKFHNKPVRFCIGVLVILISIDQNILSFDSKF